MEKEAWRPASLQVTEAASPQPEAQTGFPGLHYPWPQNSRTATPSPMERVRTIAQPHPVPPRESGPLPSHTQSHQESQDPCPATPSPSERVRTVCPAVRSVPCHNCTSTTPELPYPRILVGFSPGHPGRHPPPSRKPHSSQRPPSSPCHLLFALFPSSSRTLGIEWIAPQVEGGGKVQGKHRFLCSLL